MGLSLTGQEAVELHQELKVNIVALGRLAVSAAHVVAVEINTYSSGKAMSALLFMHALSAGSSSKKNWMMFFFFPTCAKDEKRLTI